MRSREEPRILHPLGRVSVPSPVHAFLRRVLLFSLAAMAAQSLAGPAYALRPVEPFAPYQPQVSCDPHAKQGTSAFRDLMLRRFDNGHDLGIARACDVGGDSEHKEGRAWDWGLDATEQADRATATKALTWLTEQVAGDPARRAKRLGVMYMIWNGRIWSAARASEGWRSYNGSSPHTDHIHVSLSWNGATKRTSWWTGRVESFDHGPCQRWIGELARPWKEPRTTACPVPIKRPVADADGFYTAQTGETVRRVARFFDLAGAQVRSWNGFPASGYVPLAVGQKIRVVEPAH